MLSSPACTPVQIHSCLAGVHEGAWREGGSQCAASPHPIPLQHLDRGPPVLLHLCCECVAAPVCVCAGSIWIRCFLFDALFVGSLFFHNYVLSFLCCAVLERINFVAGPINFVAGRISFLLERINFVAGRINFVTRRIYIFVVGLIINNVNYQDLLLLFLTASHFPPPSSLKTLHTHPFPTIVLRLLFAIQDIAMFFITMCPDPLQASNACCAPLTPPRLCEHLQASNACCAHSTPPRLNEQCTQHKHSLSHATVASKAKSYTSSLASVF